MASNRARLLSSRQRQRYRARHNEKLRQVKAEREREGKIADVMFGVEQTLRANRAGECVVAAATCPRRSWWLVAPRAIARDRRGDVVRVCESRPRRGTSGPGGTWEDHNLDAGHGAAPATPAALQSCRGGCPGAPLRCCAGWIGRRPPAASVLDAPAATIASRDPCWRGVVLCWSGSFMRLTLACMTWALLLPLQRSCLHSSHRHVRPTSLRPRILRPAAALRSFLAAQRARNSVRRTRCMEEVCDTAPWPHQAGGFALLSPAQLCPAQTPASRRLPSRTRCPRRHAQLAQLGVRTPEA